MKYTRLLSLILAVAMALSVGAFASGESASQASNEPSSEASGEPSGEVKTVEEAYVEYIREWLQNELAHNDQITQEQIDNEYMPLIEAGDYTSFPACYLYDGWLETGTAMTFEEFAAQYQPASGEVTWADYQAWLISILPEICPFPEAVGEIILATNSWDEIDMDNGPWGKIFGEDAFNCTTWAEFQANGGVGTYNADFVDLPAEDAPAASGEAS